MHTLKLRLVAILLSTALSTAGTASAQEAASDLGKVDFRTSGSPAAQSHFLRGAAALHSFWYDEAADAFRDAQKAEPGFAMAYWGEAMTYNHPIWSEQDRDAALAALARLAPTVEERAAKAPTEREKGFLAAVEALYGEGEKEERDTAYAEAMQKLAERFPEDLDVAAFYALARIGPALTGPPGELRARTLIQAAADLEELFEKNPEHPGGLHYMIHAYDDPLHAPLGLRAARLYARTAPAAHHALHMPSHIFLQLGDWAATAASNEASWAASADWVKRRGLTVDKQDFHSLSWLLYAYLQQGRLSKARETLEIAQRLARDNGNLSRVTLGAQGMQARWLVETRTWSKDALPAAPKEEPAGDPAHAHHGGGGPMYQWANGASLLAVGLGAARSGDLAAAEGALARLRKLDDPVLEKQVAAAVLLKQGKPDEALKLLAEAADLEAKMAPPMGPPEPMKPSHELYGEALLELGKATEAAKQFDLALLRMPNRTGSLLGAARAAAKLGDDETARRHYTALAAIWSQADPGFADLAEVRAYLEKAPESRPAR